MDVVIELSAHQFILVLRRFIAERKVPQLLVCDNAPQQKAGEKVVNEAWSKAIHDEDVQNFCATRKIEWRFTTEIAS